MRIKGVKTLHFSGVGNVSPVFCRSSKFVLLSPSKLRATREAIHVSIGSYMTSGQLVSLLWKHSCAFILMVLFLRSIITDLQDENNRTKKLGSQI